MRVLIVLMVLAGCGADGPPFLTPPAAQVQ